MKDFSLIADRSYSLISVGMSGAEVRDFGDCILKIQPASETSYNETVFMRFLKGRIAAPEVICYQTVDGLDYLLMTKLRGKMLCDKRYLSDSRLLFEKAGEALHKLWSIPASECPADMSLSVKLRLAEKNVTENRVDLDSVNPTTFGENGRFKSPEHLLQWLKDNKPEEDIAVSHGDFCLPNIFDCGTETAILDFPYGGRADRYSDIALLYRSCKDNLQGKYAKAYCNFDEELFFSVLGVSPDYDKIDYYILLDELF